MADRKRWIAQRGADEDEPEGARGSVVHLLWSRPVLAGGREAVIVETMGYAD